jgi:hypothetical protein
MYFSIFELLGHLKKALSETFLKRKGRRTLLILVVLRRPRKSILIISIALQALISKVIKINLAKVTHR